MNSYLEIAQKVLRVSRRPMTAANDSFNLIDVPCSGSGLVRLMI